MIAVSTMGRVVVVVTGHVSSKFCTSSTQSGLGYNFVSILSDGRIMSQAIENILKEMKEDSVEKKSSIY